MTLSQLPDEDALRAVFEQVELPPGLEARWRARAAAPEKGERAARRPWLHPANPWLRAAAASVAAVATVGVVAVVATNQSPSDKPNPDVIHIIEDPTIRPSPPPPSSISKPPPSGSVAPPSPGAAPPSAGQGQGPGGAPTGPPPAGGKPVPNRGGSTGIAPARGPLTEWPNHDNAGIPPGTALRRHDGHLFVTTPGAIISDLQVYGSLHVSAPDVTLRRVEVINPDRVWVVMQVAPRLTIEDSKITGGGDPAVTSECVTQDQDSPGLTIRRSILDGCYTGLYLRARDAMIVDNVVTGRTDGPAMRITDPGGNMIIRHNNIDGTVFFRDPYRPVADVTVENNILGDGLREAVKAPGDPGSHSIRVLNNHFRYEGARPTPAIGWNGQAPGNTWTGNVWFGTSEPVSP